MLSKDSCHCCAALHCQRGSTGQGCTVMHNVGQAGSCVKACLWLCVILRFVAWLAIIQNMFTEGIQMLLSVCAARICGDGRYTIILRWPHALVLCSPRVSVLIPEQPVCNQTSRLQELTCHVWTAACADRRCYLNLHVHDD